MIKKARLNFVGITMVILFFVFWVMGTVSYWALDKNNSHETNDILQKMTMTAEHGKPLMQNRGIIITVKADGETKMIFDENFFTEEYVTGLYESVLKAGISKGMRDNVHFKLTENADARIFAAIDRSVEDAFFRKAFITIIWVLFFAYLILFGIVWLLSYFVIKPVQEAFDRQNRFISDAGHELKTPLSIISASADVLAAQEQSEYVNNIKEQSQRLGLLINDLLSLAKLEEKKYVAEVKDINLSLLVTNTVLPFDAVAFEKKKTLETDIAPDIRVTADENAVIKILTILLDNALKYSDENTAVLCCLGKINGKTTLGIYNQSRTVKKGTEQKIFERFYRDDESRSRETGGSGLGLSIAKKIADLNGWNIYAEIEDKKSIAVCVQFK